MRTSDLRSPNRWTPSKTSAFKLAQAGARPHQGPVVEPSAAAAGEVEALEPLQLAEKLRDDREALVAGEVEVLERLQLGERRRERADPVAAEGEASQGLEVADKRRDVEEAAAVEAEVSQRLELPELCRERVARGPRAGRALLQRSVFVRFRSDGEKRREAKKKRK